MKNRQALIIGGIVILIIVLGIGAFVIGNQEPKLKASAGEPTDVVLDFYKGWLKAAQSTTTTPYKEGLTKQAVLSLDLRARLRDAEKANTGVDPVLCQSTVPATIGTRVVYQVADKAQILVTATHASSTDQAIVTLLPLEGGWYIRNIECSAGEVAPIREFSFDHEGNLLKGGTKPLDAKYWYLVFEENGQQGHYAPLLFSAASMCTSLAGTTAVCAPDSFEPAAKAHVQGELTETGVTVKKIEMLK